MSFWGVLVAGGMVLAVLAELLARAWIRFGRYYPNYPRVIATFRPDREVHHYLDEVVHFRTNKYGERCGPLPLTRSCLRLVLVGGSAVENRLHNWEHSWPGALEEALSRSPELKRLGFERAYVGNTGRSGGGNAESVKVTLEKILPKYRGLDAVVIMVGASEVLNWMKIGTPADKPAAQRSLSVSFFTHPEIQLGLTPRRLALAELYRRWKARRPKQRDNVARWMGAARQRRGSEKNFIEEVPDPGIMLTHFRENLRSALRLAGEGGHLVVLARQPWLEKEEFTLEEQSIFWNYCIGTAYDGKVEGYYSDKVIYRLLRAVDEEAARVAEEEGVCSVDLNSAIGQDITCFFDRNHFRKKTGPIIAEILAEHIVTELTG